MVFWWLCENICIDKALSLQQNDHHDIIDKDVTDRSLKHFIFCECLLCYLSDHIGKQWDEIVNCAHNYDAMDSLYQKHINTLRPKQNGHHFADDTFKRIFLNENIRISMKYSLKVVPNGPINNIPALVQIMACRLVGAKPLSETMMVRSLTHICIYGMIAKLYGKGDISYLTMLNTHCCLQQLTAW